MLNTNKIKGAIKEKGLTQKDVAQAVGIAQSTLSQKINNIRAMNLNEAIALSALLDIKPAEFDKYFFA